MIQQKDGWFLYENNWYYSEDGKLYTDGFYRIGNEKYGFDYCGAMLKGNGTYWVDSEHQYRYLTNDAGVVQESNGWVKYDGNWYYFNHGKWQYVNGLYPNSAGWWYVEDGQVDFSHEGLET